MLFIGRFCLILITIFGAKTERATFQDVSLSTFYEEIGKIHFSNTLRDHLPKNFTHSVIVTGRIDVLRENSVTNIDNVQELYFRRNGIEDIEPGAFKNLTSVTSLTISQSKLKTIKEGVFDKLTIRELQVSYNPISIISKKFFGDLPQLHHLGLPHNEIEDIKPDAFDRVTKLQILDLSNNKLSKLPRRVLQSLPNLQMLILRSNNIDLQEEALTSSTTDHLDLANNSISTIPDDLFSRFPNLTRIILSFNKLTMIPKGIFNKQPLHQVELTNNQISFIDPEAFDDMPNLANIMLSSNQLTKYDPQWFHNTPNIYRLFLSYNLLTELPDDAFKNIYNHKKQWIKVDNNKIEKISPETFKSFKNINHLNLGSNGMKVWSAKFLENAEKIDFLSLVDNEIKCPDGDFDVIFRGNYTYLSGNPLTEECIEKIKRWSKQNPDKLVCIASVVC